MPDANNNHGGLRPARQVPTASFMALFFYHSRAGLLVALVACITALLIPGLPEAAEAAMDQTRYTVSPRFGTRKAELSALDRQLLDGIAAQWRGLEDLHLEVVGHTDNIPIAVRNRKEFANNQVLSEARAGTVASYLARQLNIPATRMRIVGMGDRAPIASNATVEGRATNRRVDVTLRVVSAAAPRSQPPPSAGARTAVLQRARVLLDQGKPGESLVLLRSVESELIGNADFDYLYGLAALESNELGEAMFALQRAVEMDPNYAAARMELARAHFQTGDLPEAKRQFEVLAGLNPPATARAAINERLSMIERMQALLEPRVLYYLKTGGGYDSNANSATTLNNFLGFDLSEQSRETSSPFVTVGGGVRYLKPHSRSLAFDTRLDLSHRANFEAAFVDSTGARFNAGLRQEKASQIRSLGLQGYRQHVDGSLNSQGLGIAGQWNFKLDESFQVGVFGRVGTTRYGDDLKVKDVYEYLGGVSGSMRFGESDQGLAGISLVYGLDKPIEDGSRYARDLYGLRGFANWIFSSKLRGGLSLGVLKADYDEIFFPLEYDQPREDTLLQGQLSAAWQFRPEWVLSPSLGYYRNSTDVEIFEFDRFELMLSVSRLW